MNSHSENHPHGVRHVHLGEIVRVVGGKPAPQNPKAFSDGGIPFVRMRDLGRYHLTTNLTKVDDHIAPEYAEEKNIKSVRAGSILMPRSGSVALNHRAILGRDSIIVSHIVALDPDETQVHNKFLYYYLCSITLEKITKKTTGLDAINFSDLRQLQIPLPPLNEQRRIAAILDKADVIRRKREQALDLADEFLRSVFLEMFGDPLINSKSLPTKPLSGFGKIVTGNTPPRANPRNYGNHIEWIKSDNINTPEHFLTNSSEHLSKEGMQLGRTVPAGSILVICIAGSPSSIGKVAIADRSVALNQQINAITPNANVDQFFLYSQFLVGQRLIQGVSTNSMKGMVSKGKFKEIEFLAPEPEEQQEFGRIFKKYLHNNNVLREAYQNSHNLFASLSQRAFRGEL